MRFQSISRWVSLDLMWNSSDTVHSVGSLLSTSCCHHLNRLKLELLELQSGAKLNEEYWRRKLWNAGMLDLLELQLLILDMCHKHMIALMKQTETAWWNRLKISCSKNECDIDEGIAKISFSIKSESRQAKIGVEGWLKWRWRQQDLPLGFSRNCRF